jgi:hypothetical protein
MRDESKRPCPAADGKRAAGKAQTKPTGQKRNSRQKPKTPPQQREEEAEAESTEQITPNPRYYQSTTKKV